MPADSLQREMERERTQSPSRAASFASSAGTRTPEQLRSQAVSETKSKRAKEQKSKGTCDFGIQLLRLLLEMAYLRCCFWIQALLAAGFCLVPRASCLVSARLERHGLRLLRQAKHRRGGAPIQALGLAVLPADGVLAGPLPSFLLLLCDARGALPASSSVPHRCVQALSRLPPSTGYQNRALFAAQIPKKPAENAAGRSRQPIPALFFPEGGQGEPMGPLQQQHG